MITVDEFNSFIEQNLVYEEQLISIINYQGQQIFLDNLGQLHSNYGQTIKVEGMEKYNSFIFNECKKLSVLYNHEGPITCHAFRAFDSSNSFPKHCDPDDVYLFVVDGQFDLNIKEKKYTLKKGDNFFISAGEPHFATHNHSCLILSFGLEKFLVNKI